MTTDAIAKLLDASPSVQIIHMNSQGGRMTEAYRLYTLIKDRHLITYTSGTCASACSIAFLAGRERYLGENGRLGFHSVRFGELSGTVATELNDQVRERLGANGVPVWFINHALSTAPKDMWYPTKEELLVHILDPSRSVEGNFRIYAFFVHFWANDDAAKLAKGLQAALSKIAVGRN
jgi:hypothetical protein